MNPLLTLLIGLLGFTQQPTWKTAKYQKLSIKYPPDWTATRAKPGERDHISITPDSMKHLSMQMVEIADLPLPAGVSYAEFKEKFPDIIRENPEAKIVKTQEITLKGRLAMCADIINSSLPGRVYGIYSGNTVYFVFLTLSRHVKVKDPKMEKDEAAMMDSITWSDVAR